MLPKETNDLVTRIGPGTPGGDLVRRYWQPVALTEEVPAGGAPLPVRLMGEDLVLFRTEGGKGQVTGVRGREGALSAQHPALSTEFGLLGIHCSHRGADLSYGRLEDGGLRCIYHGWLYDITGRCLEQPGEPAGSTFHEKIQHRAYPCIERSQAIFAYLGPGEPPLFPTFEFLTAPPGHTLATKIFSECNYLQGTEGNIDSTHGAFVHRVQGMTRDPGNHRWFDITETEEVDYGLTAYWVRDLGDSTQIHINSFVMPNFCAIPRRAAGSGYIVNWHVPIDDEHHWKYIFHFRADEPLHEETERAARMPVTDGYYPVPHKANRYLQDRSLMADVVYSGIRREYFQAQDLCVIEGQTILDRTQEHLGPMDHAIVAARGMLVRAIQDVQEGLDPPGVLRAPAEHRLLPYAKDLIVPGVVDWHDYAH